MNSRLLHSLIDCETDVAGALRRFSGNEDIYTSYILAFPKEKTMPAFEKAITEKRWEDAFMSAHALKGLTANLGFVPLYHAVGEMVVILRDARYDEAEVAFEQTKKCYDILIAAIQSGLMA